MILHAGSGGSFRWRTCTGVMVLAAGFMLSACSAAPPTSRTSTIASGDAEIPAPDLAATDRADLIGLCIGRDDRGPSEFDDAGAIIGQRPSDERWLIAIPVEREALRHGEQHCVISGTPGGFHLDFVETELAWPEGQFAKWLDSPLLWYEL